MYNYAIYQMPFSNDSKFRSFDEVKENIKITDYVLVYCGVLEEDFESEETEEMLSDIFCILNMERPKDYYAHSLSVSDVVKLEDDFYYCDDMNWVKMSKERFLK